MTRWSCILILFKALRASLLLRSVLHDELDSIEVPVASAFIFGVLKGMFQLV